jgi:arginine decarboxylase
MNYTPSKREKETLERPIFVREERETIITGNRIPQDYFVTQGTGESDITIHAGSYHLALKECGIEMCNIITYSSIMPGVARQTEKPNNLIHGSVMESIMAVSHAKKGERATAGIIYGWLYNKKTNKKLGGLVCEHNGNYTEDEIEGKLHASLNELYINGFDQEFDIRETTLLKESLVPTKNFGTAMVAICFTSYIYPIIKRF